MLCSRRARSPSNYHCHMAGRFPLPTLLSHALVAFTIEFDNESEHQLPHRTTNFGSTAGAFHAPWLVSLVMWLNCMRFVDEAGITARELEERARTKTNLNGMERWGYVLVEPDPNDTRPKPPRSSWLIRPTRAGRKAQEVWRPLLAVIEDRWRKRFGEAEIDRVRTSLSAVVEQLDFELPDCLPILGYGLFTAEGVNRGAKPTARAQESTRKLSLASLLAKVLLAFAIEFESESEVSLAICANVLRLIGQEPVPLRELPRMAGVSKEGIAMALTFLSKRQYAIVESKSRVKILALTPKGQQARDKYLGLLRDIEQRWQTRFGRQAIGLVRDSLEPLAGTREGERSALFAGLTPYPDGWRASVPQPSTLPHFPMVLHRGGWPDGS